MFLPFPISNPNPHLIIAAMFRGALTSAATVFVASHFISVRRVSGRSMSPTINPNTHLDRDIILFDTLTPLLVFLGLIPYGYTDITAKNGYKASQIILFTHPEDCNMELVKRIHFVNDSEASLFVLGDEPYKSIDSRMFGKIPLGLVNGIAIGIIWPPDRIQFLDKEQK